MTWSRTETEYDGLPLLLRRPNHQGIWSLQNDFSKLVLIKHNLSKVCNDGLPDSDYNDTLAEYDSYMCNLFCGTDNGIIILIETYSGSRNYFYYVHHRVDVNSQLNAARKKFEVDLTIVEKIDRAWEFLTGYPIELFPK